MVITFWLVTDVVRVHRSAAQTLVFYRLQEGSDAGLALEAKLLAKSMTILLYGAETEGEYLGDLFRTQRFSLRSELTLISVGVSSGNFSASAFKKLS